MSDTQIHKKKSTHMKKKISSSDMPLTQIQATLTRISEKTNQVHGAMFDPENGMINKMSEIKQWKESKDKEESKTEKKLDALDTRVKHVETGVNDLTKSAKLIQWFAVAVVGAIITIATSWIQSKMH